jgi:ribosomal protein S6--L-glutamate ligase
MIQTVNDVAVVHYPSQRAPNWTLLQRAADARGVRLTTLEPHRIAMIVSDETAVTTYDGTPIRPRIAIHRTISPFQGIMTPAIAQWQQDGTVVLNEIGSSFRARDKLLTTLALRAAKVPVVPTSSFDEPTEDVLTTLPAGRLILKPAHGVRGEGIDAFADARTLVGTWGLSGERRRRRTDVGYHIVREHYLAQPLIRGGGTDLRAYVVGGRCVGLMRRQARPGEIRANMELGATAEPVSLAHPAAATAVAALQACGLDLAGVDLIEDDEGVPRILEVDAWAGFAGMTASTGADVAGAILDLALARGTDRSPR